MRVDFSSTIWTCWSIPMCRPAADRLRRRGLPINLGIYIARFGVGTLPADKSDNPAKTGVRWCPRKLASSYVMIWRGREPVFLPPIFSDERLLAPPCRGGAMRHRTESGLSSRSREFVLLLVFLAVVFGAPARAEMSGTGLASTPKYDLKTRRKI